MNKKTVSAAIDKLANEFSSLNFPFTESDSKEIHTSEWLGKENEEIMVCVFKGNHIDEPFHRQDFFFINYAYKESYNALSAKFDNLITIKEGECYIGQPYSGYALKADSEKQVTIIGILVKRDLFFRELLPLIYADSELFRFFIEPNKNRFSEEYLHLTDSSDYFKFIMEVMTVEYAKQDENYNLILKSLLQTLFFYISRENKRHNMQKNVATSLSERILKYLSDHNDVVSLKAVAKEFSYHPNYISSLLRKETGKTFSQIVLEKRMERAVLMLKNTTLSIEEIAALLGYSDKSNFYKAFRDYFSKSPREYLKL